MLSAAEAHALAPAWRRLGRGRRREIRNDRGHHVEPGALVALEQVRERRVGQPAVALGVDVVIHPDARAILAGYYESRGGLNEARLRMARVPAGADLIPNRMSGAPGIKVGNIFIMAGVPSITAGMLDALTGTLEGGLPVLSATVGCWVAESEIADLLRQTEHDHEGVAIGSYPFFREGRVGANFVIRSTDPVQLETCSAALAAALGATGREAVSGGI